VYRRLDDQLKNLPADSPEAWKLHRRRAKALHDIFDRQTGLRVVKWGDTDDTKRTHEWVELLIEITKWLADPATIHAVSSGAQQVAQFLAATAATEAVKESMKYLFVKLRNKQKTKQIGETTIWVTPKTRIQLNPLDSGTDAYILTHSSGKWSLPHRNLSKPGGRQKSRPGLR
jgi:hypothetical protein